jgi:hypothetical protein
MAKRSKKAAAKKAAAKKGGGAGKARGSRTASPPAAEFTNLTNEAQFVFRGTVQQRGAATLDQVELTRDTLVVSVDEILKSTEVLLGFQGMDITVQLGPGQRAETSKTYVFYTNGWIYGAGLAVRAVGIVDDADFERRQARVALESAPARAIQERAERAELVVTGQVAEVREVPRIPGTPITEHDPVWQQAVINVDSVEQSGGTGKAPKQVVIRFAASPDVRWATAPKFTVGQAGVWMLGDKAQGPEMRAAARAAKNEYVVVEPDDYFPIEWSPQVRSFLRSESEEEK